jgi:branched-chain amino acid transport system substrate-binding protein
MKRAIAILLVILLATSGLALAVAVAGMQPEPVRIGAVFPLSNTAGVLAEEQLGGVEVARDMVNDRGGIDGRPIELAVEDLTDRASAGAIVDRLADRGVAAVMGAYASDLSVIVSQAASDADLIYWEAGAVADTLTGRGLPLVFRVGAIASNLGANSAVFTATELAPRLGRDPADVRLAIVQAQDDYAETVAKGAREAADAHGLAFAGLITYNLVIPEWDRVFDELAAADADVVVLAAHIDDGVAFRKAWLEKGFKAEALIGSTMAQCLPIFGELLGPDAIGVFASDRPTAGFNPEALSPDALDVYEEFAAIWRDRTGREPSEESIAGFSAAGALVAEVLPRAEAVDDAPLDQAAILAAARGMDMPEGALPNGAGLHFSSNPASLGQNERAAAVVWQWQGVEKSVTVWPAVYQTGSIKHLPLER